MFFRRKLPVHFLLRVRGNNIILCVYIYLHPYSVVKYILYLCMGFVHVCVYIITYYPHEITASLVQI